MMRVAEAEKDLFRRSQYKALKSQGDLIKNAGRDAVRKAKIRGASRLATAIRGDVFPRGKNIYPKSPAYVIGTNAEIPLANLETGATISAKGGGLMIPIGEAAKFKQPNFTERAGRLSRTIAAMEAKYGKLSWHKLRDGTLAMGAWAKTRSGGQMRFKALFIVRKSVTIPKKHDATAQMQRAAQGWDTRVAEETMRLFMAEHPQVVGRITGTLSR
jgi:hypothetical protein